MTQYTYVMMLSYEKESLNNRVLSAQFNEDITYRSLARIYPNRDGYSELVTSPVILKLIGYITRFNMLPGLITLSPEEEDMILQSTLLADWVSIYKLQPNGILEPILTPTIGHYPF